MKVAPLHRAFQKYSSIRHMIVHTGQHYDANMSKIFFEDLQLPQPDVYLGVGSGSHAAQTAKVMTEFEQVVLREKPDLVMVVGDVNSTLACSLVCSKLGTRVAHVEAGLRSFDRRMPEEINRLVTDAIADLLFVSEPSGITNLKKEGVADERVFFVGNVMIDSLIQFLEKARRSSILESIGISKKSYVLVTLHRPSNVDVKENLEQIFSMFEKMSEHGSIIFPIHPRTRKMIDQFGLSERVQHNKKLILTDPIGYVDFLCLLDSSSLVVTDSGGIQEETTYLGVPCLTMRENTERPVTVSEGTNQLMGFDYNAVLKESEKIFRSECKKGQIPKLWDGHAAERITKIVAEQILN